MKLLFETSVSGRSAEYLPELDVPALEPVRGELARKSALDLPELSEVDVDRHYSALERRTHGVNNGMYMLGSCTMKYNPQVNEVTAALPGFASLHPLQPAHTCQGALEALVELEGALNEICGMDATTFQPAAGAHGELTGLLLIKAYHEDKGDAARTKILVPDAAHGTNPASAAMAGLEVVAIPATEKGGVDVEALAGLVGPDTAGLMLTNPNTEGMFDENILEITRLVHEAGGLNYYDGANLNAIMGVVRPGDMGFDVIHLNLHKTFSTPHGGGGPGSCAVGVKDILMPYLPGPHAVSAGDGRFEWMVPAKSIGRVRSFQGNFLVTLRALTYVLTLGKEGIPASAKNAVLNANYMMKLLEDIYPMVNEGLCMHEFVMTLEKLKKETGITAKDVAKGLLDYGVHPPTMYFPLTVHEALMVEPTETEPKETLDAAAQAFRELYEKAHSDPEWLHTAPHTTPVCRPDEVLAAREPKLRYVATKE